MKQQLLKCTAAVCIMMLTAFTGNNAYHTLQVPVTDGQLNICTCAGKENNAYTMSALEIKQISTQTHTNPTIGAAV